MQSKYKQLEFKKISVNIKKMIETAPKKTAE